MMIYLVELGLFSIIFISCQLYSLIRFYQSISQYHLGQILLNYEGDFEVKCENWFQRYITTWTCNQPHDITDLEWNVAKNYFLGNKAIFLFGHCTGFWIMRKISPKNLTLFIIFYSTFCLWFQLGPYPVILIYINILISTFISKFPSLFKKHKNANHYLFFIISIFFNNMYHAIPDDVEINFSINLSLSWLNAKLLSSAIDCTTIEKTNKMSTLFIYRLAYLLYFPVFLFGPIFHFTDFHNSLSKLQNGSSTINQTTYLLSIGRYIFWAYFLENFLKYYVYSSALLNYPNILLQLDQWSIAGFGFSLMLTFYIKYLILYGISGSISRLDGFDQHMIAEAPRCIAHMSKTSYLWRKFDQGLYRFLVKYFYRPITGDTGNHRNPIRRFMASAVCFGIIAVWHEQAESFSIIIWVIVNFLLLNFETLCSIIRKQSFLKNIESSNNFVRSIMSRLEAIIGSPYLAAAYLSNILFLSNYESTWIIIQKLFFDPYSISLLFAVLYAGCHVCNYLNNEGTKETISIILYYRTILEKS